jgi:magnesium-protoporphyrin O-methyltransferase
MTFFAAGKLFPRSDRSPTMIPHSPRRIAARNGSARRNLLCFRDRRVSRGFYISTCLEYRA